MRTYQFSVYLTLFDDTEVIRKHTVLASSYQKAYSQLLLEVPHSYIFDTFFISPAYTVNGKKRFCK